MSEEPYNPCDENDHWILVAKDWELLRRNQDFRELMERIIREDDTEEYRGLSTRLGRTNPSASHLVLFGSSPGLIGDEIRREPFILDVPFRMAMDRLGTPFLVSVNEIDQHRLYVCPPEGFDEHEVFGIYCSYWEVDPYEADSDHHVFLIPKSMPNATARDRMLNSIKPLIELEGIKEKNLRAPKRDKTGKWQGGGHNGSGEEWSAFLAVENYLLTELEDGEYQTPEIIGEAMWEAIYQRRGSKDGTKDTWKTTYETRYYRIKHLINDAFPDLSELE